MTEPTTEQLLEALPTIRANELHKAILREYLKGEKPEAIARKYGLADTYLAKILRDNLRKVRVALSPEGPYDRLPERIKNALWHTYGIDGMEGMISTFFPREPGRAPTEPELLRIPNFGRKSLKELQGFLLAHGTTVEDQTRRLIEAAWKHHSETVLLLLADGPGAEVSVHAAQRLPGHPEAGPHPQVVFRLEREIDPGIDGEDVTLLRVVGSGLRDCATDVSVRVASVALPQAKLWV